jgi:uncharacterized protein YjbI with pentapeptide repeats
MISLFNLERFPLTPAMHGETPELLQHLQANSPKIERGDFRNFVFKSAIQGLHFLGCSFDQASLRNVRISNCIFENCTFVEANLDDCNLDKCRFEGCDFSSASFIGAIQNATIFAGNDFSRALTFFLHVNAFGLSITAIDEILHISTKTQSISVSHSELFRDWYHVVHTHLALSTLELRMLSDSIRHIQNLLQYWLKRQSTPHFKGDFLLVERHDKAQPANLDSAD